jgi:hypothetical protein
MASRHGLSLGSGCPSAGATAILASLYMPAGAAYQTKKPKVTV